VGFQNLVTTDKESVGPEPFPSGTPLQ